MKAKRIKINPPPPPDEIQLTLSLEEAELLKKFSGQVGGDNTVKGNSRKFYELFCEIFQVLHNEGVESSLTNFQVITSGGRNSLKVGDR